MAVFLILLPFGSSLRQCLLVSWSSLRGAASIVFAIILSVPSFREEHDGKLKEILVEPGHNWCNSSIADLNLPENILIALIKRGDENIIPQGSTVIHANDTVVIFK